MKYLVIIADIVASRTVSPRSRLQTHLKKALDDINRTHRGEIVSPYTITLGDEFQAVLKTPDTVFSQVHQILAAIHPVKARFAIAVGTIETRINRRQAIGMDGGAFYAARKGLEQLKKRQMLYAVSGLREPVLGLAQESLDLVSQTSGTWKRSRQQIFALLTRGLTVKTIASATRMTDKAVYKSIDAGALRTIHAIFDRIAAIMNDELRLP